MNFPGFSINSFHLFFCLTLDISQHPPKRKMSAIRTETFFLPSLFHWRWETLNYQLWFICEYNYLSLPGCLNYHISPAVTPSLAPPKHPEEFLLSTYMDMILPALTVIRSFSGSLRLSQSSRQGAGIMETFHLALPIRLRSLEWIFFLPTLLAYVIESKHIKRWQRQHHSILDQRNRNFPAL